MVSKVHCKEDLPNVVLDPNCNRLKDSVCSFSCKEGYQKKDEDIVELVCMSNGKWNLDHIPLCVGVYLIVTFIISLAVILLYFSLNFFKVSDLVSLQV